ncbi:MAG: site-specific DNA-methyltransferase, partial [Nitrospiria bacterium]
MTSRNVPHGPDNPHPLSTMKTELVWEGKYDCYGNRREVDIAGAAMPMQKIETVDEPRSRNEAQGELFDSRKAHPDDFRNRLIWGDNKLVMASLLKEFKGKIDLIYIDPPFDVGADFTMNVPIGDEKETVGKDQSTLEMVAYRDMWGKGTDSYLHMMYERLVLMRELLSETGSIYVHCDWRVNSFVRLVLDEVFRRESFRNEIIWCYSGGGVPKKDFAKKHDTVYRYSKGNNYIFNVDEVRQSYSEEILSRPKSSYAEHSYRNKPNEKTTAWNLNPKGKYPDDWFYMAIINPEAKERLAFPTQKPEALLERIIKASSNKGDLVADLFCGSGTTGAVAECLGRRWIMADLGRFAIHTSRRRMIELQRKLHEEKKPYRPFDLYNLGRYERQWWQKERLQGADEEHRRVVLEFFRAEVLQQTPSPLLHGRKNRAFCHVDGIDSMFTRDEARGVVEAVAATGGKEVYCLAWEFEMDLRLTTAALEKEYGVKMKLIPIPREIMEKNRTEVPPFFEVAL